MNGYYTPKMNETILVTRPSGKQFEAKVTGYEKLESGKLSIIVQDKYGIEERIGIEFINKIN